MPQLRQPCHCQHANTPYLLAVETMHDATSLLVIVFIRILIRTIVRPHDGADELLVLEHLASLGSQVGVHVAVKGSSPSESIHDLINLTGSQRLLAGLGFCVEKSIAQLNHVHLAAIVVIESRKGGEQVGTIR